MELQNVFLLVLIFLLAEAVRNSSTKCFSPTPAKRMAIQQNKAFQINISSKAPAQGQDFHGQEPQ